MIARFAALILALAAPPAVGAEQACSTPPIVGVEAAHLVLQPDQALNRTTYILSGQARLASSDGMNVRPADLCIAALGPALSINNEHLCQQPHTLDRFTTDDRVHTHDGVVDFTLVRGIAASGPFVSILLRQGDRVCAKTLDIEVRHDKLSRFNDIGGLPSELSPDRVLVHLTSDPQPAFANWWVTVEPVGDAPFPPPSALHGPPSWSVPFGRVGLSVQELASPLVLIAAILGLLITTARRVNPSEGDLRLWVLLLPGLGLALGFDVAVVISRLAEGVVDDLFHGVLSPNGFLGALTYRQVGQEGRYDLEPVKALVAVAITLVFCSLWIGVAQVSRRWDEPRRGWVRLAPTALLAGGLIASLSGAMAVVIDLLEAHLAVGYEAPALLLSFLLATAALGAARRLFRLNAVATAAVAAVLALTALFPTAAVVTGNGLVTAAMNTWTWGAFVSQPIGRFLFVGVLAAAAYRLDFGDAARVRANAIWIAMALALEVAEFGLSSIMNTAAFGALVAVLPSFLLSGRQADVDDPLDAKTIQLFPFRVAAVATGVFLLQFIFRTDGVDTPARFTALNLGTVITVFSVGLTAGLLLVRAMPVLRGDSPTAKALIICVVIALANVASSFGGLHGRQALIGALAEEMNVVSSLLFCTFVYFELPKIRDIDGQINWKGAFKGTGLAAAVPVVSGLAVAMYAALSPIFFSKVGDAFGLILQNALPHVATTVSTH